MMAKSKRADDSTIAAAADYAPKPQAQPATVTTADIARRAYDLYLTRGGEAGHDVEDWLRAERELRRANGA
jgi:hypothetical protein